MKQVTEVWLKEQIIEGICPLLQPVAHALLQAKYETGLLMADFPDELLWERPAYCASVGFHLLHIKGVLHRLLCYAEGKSLTSDQLNDVANESDPRETTASELLVSCHEQIDLTLERLKQFPSETLTEARGVGRAQLPSTIIGLCTHAAEHTMRHVGQLLVTTKVLLHSE